MRHPGKVGGASLPGDAAAEGELAAALRDDAGVWLAGVELMIRDLAAGELLPGRVFLCGGGAQLPWLSGLPVVKPPYGRITAIDMNKGDIKWTVANGDGPRDHPAINYLNLPPLGQPGRAAPLITKSLVFMGEGGNGGGILALPPWGGGKKFRAFDKETGAVVSEIELPGGTIGAPMTYQVDGKQYMIVSVSGGNYSGEFIAFALPDSEVK